MLLELIIFAFVFVVLQMAVCLLVGYLLMKKFTSKKFIKDYSKMLLEVTKDITEEMEDLF